MGAFIWNAETIKHNVAFMNAMLFCCLFVQDTEINSNSKQDFITYLALLPTIYNVTACNQSK